MNLPWRQTPAPGIKNEARGLSLNRPLRNAPAYWQAGIRGVIRPPHRLGGVARSRSLFVATPPLVLAPLDKRSQTLGIGQFFFKTMKNKLATYLTGQVVATYIQVRLTPQDFACLPQAGIPLARERHGGVSRRCNIIFDVI